MALSLVGTSAAPIFGTTTATATFPTGYTVVAGDRAYLFVDVKQTATVVSTPAGWTLLGTVVVGTGAVGAGSGPLRLTIFFRDLVGGDTLPATTHANTNAVIGVTCAVYRKASDEFFDHAIASMSDAGSSTDFSGTATADPGFITNDLVAILSGLTISTTSISASSIVATGATFSALTKVHDVATTNGDDLRFAFHTGSVTAGTSTAAPVPSTTTSGSNTGGQYILRVRATKGPVIRSVTSAGETSPSTTVTTLKPPGLVVDDYLLAIHSTDADETATANMTAPSGFVEIGSQLGNVANNIPCLKIWGKKAVSADVSASNFVFGNTSAPGSAIILIAIQIGTYDTTTPIDLTAFTTQARIASNVQTAPAGTATADDYHIAVFCADTNGVAQSYPAVGPAGMQFIGTAQSSGFFALLGAYGQARPTAGTTGTKTVTPTGATGVNGWTTVSILVNPVRVIQNIAATVSLVATPTIGAAGTVPVPDIGATVTGRDQGVNDTAASSHNVNLPAGIVAGERLLVFFTNDNATCTASTTSTGWIKLGTESQGTTTNHTGTVFWKIATGSDALVVNLTETQEATWTSYRILTNSSPELTSMNNASTASFTPTPITPSSGTQDYLVLLGVGVDASASASQTVTFPAGFINKLSQNPGITSSAGTFSAEQTYTSVSTITPGSVSLSTAEQIVEFTVAFKATVAGVTTVQGTVTLTATPAITVSGDVTAVASVSLTVTPSISAAGISVAVATVTLSATPSIAVAGISVAVSTVTLSATPSIIVAGLRTAVSTVSLVELPTITTVGLVTAVASVSLVQTASITVTSLRTAISTVTLSVIPSITVAAFVIQPSSVSLLLIPTITTTGLRTAVSTVSLVQLPTLTTTQFVSTFGTVSLSVTPSIVVTSTGFSNVAATVTLVQLPTIAAGAKQEWFASVSLVALPSLAAGADRTVNASVLLSQTPTIAVAGLVTKFGTVTLNAVPSISVAGLVTGFATVTLTAVPTITVGPFVFRPSTVSLVLLPTTSILSGGQTSGSVSLVILPTITLGGLRTAVSSVLLTLSPTLSVTTRQTFAASVQLVQLASVSVAGGLVTKVATVTLVQSVSIAVAADRFAISTVLLVQTATIAAAGEGVSGGSTVLTATPIITIAGRVTYFASVTLLLVPTITVGSFVFRKTSVNLTQIATLGVGTFGLTAATSALTQAVSISISGVLIRNGSVSLVLIPTLAVGALVERLAGTILSLNATIGVGALIVGVVTARLVQQASLVAMASRVISGGQITLTAIPYFFAYLTTTDVEWPVSVVSIDLGRTNGQWTRQPSSQWPKSIREPSWTQQDSGARFVWPGT